MQRLLATIVPASRIAFAIALVIALLSCTASGPGKSAKSIPNESQVLILADFEAPTDARFTWQALSSLPTTQPAPESRPAETQPQTTTAPQSSPSRSSIRPNTGLWSESVTLGGTSDPFHTGGILKYTVADPQTHALDLSKFDLISAQVTHLGPEARNGEWSAALLLIDAWGKRIEGDSFAITSRWEDASIDLHWAQDQGLDASRIVSLSLEFRKTPGTSDAETQPLEVQTDTWAARKQSHQYIGTRVLPSSAEGVQTPAGKFYVESCGSAIYIGHTGSYELTLWNRGAAADASPQLPWIEVWNGSPRRKVLGQPGTGVALFDQTSMDLVTPALHRDGDGRTANSAPVSALVPALASWPQKMAAKGITSSRWQWEVAWASPIATLVEGTQEAGPYDSLGEPALTLKWRLMIYEWGQVFVHVEWEKPGDTAEHLQLSSPASWALILDRDILEPPPEDSPQKAADAERLLTEVYPVAVREGLETVLPHRMQAGGPIAMIGRSPAAVTGGGGLAKNAWWWAMTRTEYAGGEAESGSVDLHRIFGSGIASFGNDPQQHADCMLLVNDPNPLMKAGAFGQYLVPPKIVMRQGEIDRNWPGDYDSDGFVEASGYQVIRLASGRAAFTIYPQQRPIFYPAFLFTVPAIERDALDLKHSRVLINIDGVQFADPPQFPDGSFLLQLPYVLDKPVAVEALLVKK